jgi:hypothetical protein
MSFLPRAWTGEILRSGQKDESFVREVASQISEQLLKLIGPQKWITYQPYIQAGTRFIFYCMTTLSGEK